jgi:hypothetical protein
MAKKQKTQDEATDVVNKKDIGIIPQQDMDDAKIMIDASPWKDVDLTKDRLLNWKDVESLTPIIDKLWPKSSYSPTQRDARTQELINAGMIITYKDQFDKASIQRLMQAYVYQESRGRYQIFINGNNEAEAFDALDLHEKGHILFQHTNGVNLYIEQFKKELDKIWNEKVAKWFTADAQKGYKKDKIVRFIFDQFSNIAQDMEINSKFFDNGEWVSAKKTYSRSLLKIMFKDLTDCFDDMSHLIKDSKAQKIDHPEYLKIAQRFNNISTQLVKRSNGEIDDILYCYPTYHNWPEKLDWMTYMKLLVANKFDDVMKQVQDQIQQAAGGNGSGNGQGQGQGSGGTGISKDALDKYFADDKADEDAKSGTGDSENDDSGDEDGDEKQDGYKGADGRSEGGMARGLGSGAWTGDIETCATFDSFVKLLNKICLGKELKKRTTDIMYYSNRGKTINMGGSVLPRRYCTAKWMPTAITIVIDISGSVATAYVERIINSIVSANSGVDLKKSHIIFCDTNVQGDEILDKRTRKVWSGGGTRIATGIKYAFDKKYVSKSTDKLLVVSDFEDDLNEWTKAAEGKPGIKYAIGYNVENKDNFTPTATLEQYCPSTENGKKFVKCWHTLFITEKIK